jgi:hypothetical protein
MEYSLSFTLSVLEMAAPSPPTDLWDEIPSTVQHELQQLHIEIQKVQTDLQKLRVEVVPELMQV